MSPIVIRLALLLALLAILIVGGALGFMVLEDLSFGDAVYFTVVTLSTVGYGDIHPTTTGAKVLAALLIVTGVGSFLTIVASMTQILLHRRQERLRRERVNILVSVFYSEIGTRLLRLFCGFDSARDRIRREVVIAAGASEADFARLRRLLDGHGYSIDPARMQLEPLRELLREKGDLLLRLLENPNLLEHESFTDLLRAVFHLRDELLSRPESLALPETDLAHLAGDIKRVYALLGRQWLSHMRYLESSYPYLFSLALRTNPFGEEGTAVVT